MERTKKTGIKKYKLKKDPSFSVDLQKETTHDELHKIVWSHYKTIRKFETYLGSYSEKSFLQYFNVEQIILAPHKVKKKSVQVYLHYPKPEAVNI